MADPVTMTRNKKLLEGLFSGGDHKKEAESVTNDYLKTKARENAVNRAILPPKPIGMDEMDIQHDQEAPTKIFAMEPDSPAAFTVPFGTQAEAVEITGNRGMVKFQKITTKHHTKDKHLLGTYRADLRQIITDNDLNDILEQEDKDFFTTVDSLLGGSAGTSLARAGGVALWQNIAGGLTPETWTDMLQIMVQSSARFRPQTVVMNQYLAMELMSWDGDELSQDILADLNKRGWTMDEFKGVNLIVTIKDDVVGNDEVYMFTSPDKLGRSYTLQDVTMFPEAHGNQLEWWSEEIIGCTIQCLGIAKATLTGV